MSPDLMLARILEHPHLPSPPAVALKVVDKASRPDCSLAEIAQIISHDPGLGGNILKLVNSALYGIPRSVTTVEHALHLLGLKRVRALVLSLSLPSMQCRRTDGAQLQEFWKTSVAGAVAARELAIFLGRGDPETHMVTGLLRDVGRLVLYETFPDLAKQLVRYPIADLATRSCQLEREVWGVDHAEVGARVLERWRLPKSFTDPIRFHHCPAQAIIKGNPVQEQALLLYFAHLIGQLQVTPDQPALLETIVDLGRARFGLDELRLHEFFEPLKTKIDQVAGLLRVDIGRGVDYAQLLLQTTDTLTKFVVESTVESLVLQQENQHADELRRKAEESLKISEEQVRQSQKLEAIGRLAGGIAHDFNNLLTVINGYSTLLLSHVAPGTPARGFVEHVLAAGEKAAGLTGQLLTFSRKQVVRPEDIDLNNAVTLFEKTMQSLAGDRVKLVKDLAAGLGPVRADPSQIDQVLLNLLVNARDAMPQGGSVTIATANLELEGSPYVMVSVADTGCGMDEETQRHLFEPFFTTKAKGKGTGLGLATVYGIVKQCGGQIAVETAIGQGTTFKIYLPRSTEPAAVVRPKAVSSLSGNETILVAEDDDCVRSIVKLTLEAIGYKVLEANNGEEALAVGEAFKGKIHLLLTDVIMPKLDGCELAKRLTRSRPGLKVCYISGYIGDHVLGTEIIDSGMPFLAKPFSPHVLACRVRETLAQSVTRTADTALEPSPVIA